MIQEVLKAVLAQRAASLKRRTAGAVLEVMAFGLFGLATLFLFGGLYLRLVQDLEAWLAALLVALIVALVAGLLMLAGYVMMRSRARRREGDLARELDRLGAASGRPPPAGQAGEETGQTLVAAALAAGIALGRSMRR